MDPSLLAPLYNSQAALRQIGDDEVADPLLALALKRDTMAVTVWTRDVAKENNLLMCRMSQAGNRHLMDVPLPMSRLRSVARQDSGLELPLLVPYAPALVGRGGSQGLGQTGLFGILGVLFFSLLAWLAKVSQDCSRCGGIAEPRTRIEASDEMICEPCVLSDIRKKLSDAKEQWFEEKRRAESREMWLKVCRWITYVTPGLGHLLRGRTIRGLLIVACVTAAAVLFFNGHIVVTDPRQPLEHGSGRMVILASLAGLAWIGALIDIHAVGDA